MVSDMKFGERLKSLRESANVTPDEFSKIINKSRSSLSGYETNNILPDHKTLFLIADYFDCSLDYLLGRSEFRDIEEEQLYKQKQLKYGIKDLNRYNRLLMDKLESLNTVYYRYFQENMEKVEEPERLSHIFDAALLILDKLTIYIGYYVKLLDSENSPFLVDGEIVKNFWLLDDKNELHIRISNEPGKFNLLKNFNELLFLLGSTAYKLKYDLFKSLDQIGEIHYKNINQNCDELLNYLESREKYKHQSSGDEEY